MLDQRAFATGLQRSRGAVRAGFAVREGRTRLRHLCQQGSARAILPRVGGDVPELVFLNTSGGLTGADRLDLGVDLGAGGRLTLVTQAAERAYDNRDGPAEVSVRLRLGAGARLDWLPQETILFEGADLNRRTEIDLEGDASCLICETVVLGRQAMGENPARARLTDARMVRRDGHPVWADRALIGPAMLARRDDPTVLGGARAMAVMALIGPDAEAALGPVRARLDEPGCAGAATAFDGKCLIRLFAAEGWPLRRQLVRLIDLLAQAPLSRVWQMQGVDR